MSIPSITHGRLTQRTEKKEIDDFKDQKRLVFERFGLNPTEQKLNAIAIAAFSETQLTGSGSGGSGGGGGLGNIGSYNRFEMK